MSNGIPSSAHIEDVCATIGIDLYSYFSPRDLVSLGRTSRYFSTNIRKSIISICLQQQQQRRGDSHGIVGSGSDGSTTEAEALVEISDRHSFTTKHELADHLVEKIRAANLRYLPKGCTACIDTLQETLDLVQRSISDETSWCTCSWYGSFRNDPAEIWKPMRQPSTVGCRFEDECRRGLGNRRTIIDIRLKKMHPDDINNNSILRDWARYIIAQEGMVGREWKWECDGVACIGFMIHSPSDNGGREWLEIRLKRKVPLPKLVLQPPPSPPGLLSAFGL